MKTTLLATGLAICLAFALLPSAASAQNICRGTVYHPAVGHVVYLYNPATGYVYFPALRAGTFVTARAGGTIPYRPTQRPRRRGSILSGRFITGASVIGGPGGAVGVLGGRSVSFGPGGPIYSPR